jgi:thiamine biosynthesis protein ThiI
MSGEKKCIALISGGIDSPVAIARMLKDGWKMQCVHFSLEELTGKAPEEKSVAALNHLKSLDSELGEMAKQHIEPNLIIVPVAEQASKFTEKWAHTEYFIHMKRMFHRLGDIIGKEYGATHLLTGENLGQVSSQTLGNMGAIEAMSSLIPLRPLLCFDKRHIIDMARALGTYELSLAVEVCDALGPKKPTTVANKEWLELSEQRAGGMEILVNQALTKKYLVNLLSN